jgi:hypothetical protein
MGRMLRMTSWGLGVLPSPFPDNGVEVSGSHWIGSTVQLDYAAYAVGGFKGAKDGLDIDWLQSRSPNLFYVDNNESQNSTNNLASAMLPAADSQRSSLATP